MTHRKDFKALVRARMRETGERYTAARAAILQAGRRTPPHRSDAQRRQEQVVRRMFLQGRLRSIPARRKLRAAVMLEVLTNLEPCRTYTEPEINAILRPLHDDVAYLRRELVSFGYVRRAGGRYRLSPHPPVRTEQQRQELPEWEAVWLPGYLSGCSAHSLTVEVAS